MYLVFSTRQSRGFSSRSNEGNDVLYGECTLFSFLFSISFQTRQSFSVFSTRECSGLFVASFGKVIWMIYSFLHKSAVDYFLVSFIIYLVFSTRESYGIFSNSFQGNRYMFSVPQSSVDSSLAAFKVIGICSVFSTESSVDSSVAAFKVICISFSVPHRVLSILHSQHSR